MYRTVSDWNSFHLSGQRPPSGIGSEDFDFTEVTEAIKNNSTGVEIAKKVLSKLAKLTERSEDSNSLFMMWTIPTTILALMGIVYFVGKGFIALFHSEINLSVITIWEKVLRS